MDQSQLSITLLKRFAPLDELKPETLRTLLKQAEIAQFSSGRLLFKEGDTDARAFFLVSGTVELFNRDKFIGRVTAGSPEARTALAPASPRRVSARASGDVQSLRIGGELLDNLLTWDQTGRYDVSELSGAGQVSPGDWMMTLLQSKTFQRTSPLHLQTIFMRMQRIDYEAGDLIFKQGASSDYYYVIVSGTCLVTRETKSKPIKLAELKCGGSFGEEALITQTARNATVTMASDGTLMRLSKEDFLELLAEPLMQLLDYTAAQSLVRSGAKWLDVRTPTEFQNYGIPGTQNMPLYLLRLKIQTLDQNATYIACCDTGRRSSAAAYVLSEHGFDAYVLKSGLAATHAACEARLSPAA